LNRDYVICYKYAMTVVDAMSVQVVSVRPDDRVQLAIARMIEEEVGSVAVCEGHRLVGIFTERDVLRLASEGNHFGEVRVGDVMTRRIYAVEPDDDILAAAQLMQEKRIRHVPVVLGENVLGILGVREVMRTLVERLWSRRDPAARETARDLMRRGA
jgi:CBS domain-containing protein